MSKRYMFAQNIVVVVILSILDLFANITFGEKSPLTREPMS